MWNLSTGNLMANSDALEVYLETPPLPTVDDLLAYWRLRADTEKDAALPRMALDFLSIPGTSCI